MRTAVLGIVAATMLFARTARAGELDLAVGMQGTHTAWDGDNGGGPTLSATWWFLPWLGLNFLGKEHYATVDERFMSYFSFSGAFRKSFGRVRLTGTLGVVHQHEEPRPAVEAMPIESIFGVADGTRHRMAGRGGIQLAIPFLTFRKGDLYVAVDLDTTMFSETDRGPRWMASAGASVGFSYDFARGAAR